MFQVCFTGVLMMFHGCSKSVKDVSKCVLRCFKVALMVVLKCLRLFQNFLAAMSSSRSDDVTKCVCVCLCVCV